MFRRLTIALALAASFAAGPAAAGTLTIRGDPYCPYNCDAGSDMPGYMIEIAREVFAAHGIEVVYQTTGWARAIEQARAGEIGAIVGAGTDDAPDFVFGAPLGAWRMGYVFRAGESFEIAGPDSLEGRVLGGTVDYAYDGGIIEDYIAAHGADPWRVQLLAGEDTLERNLLKLVAGRIDVLAEEITVIDHAIARLGLGADIEVVRTPLVDPLFIAFSPARAGSARLSELLDEGVAAMRADGRLAAILKRYGIADWEGELGDWP